MALEHPFAIRIERDPNHEGRFRWFIYQDGTMRDQSVYSFATQDEAKVDAEEFVQKLNATWTRDRK